MVVMKKSTYNLVFKRSLAKTKSRFLSIFLIVFLGTAFYAGLRNTPITMKNSMNSYLKKHHFADLDLISSFGFSEEDLGDVAKIDGVKQVEGAYRADVILNQPDSDEDLSIIAHSKNSQFNDNDIISGRNIENEGECLIDQRLEKYDLLNKDITIKNEQGNLTLKVVGIVNDPRYISNLIRGTNTYSQDSNDGFMIVSSEDLKPLAIPSALLELRNQQNLYNEILLAYNMDVSFYSDQYDNQTKELKASISDYLQSKLANIKQSILDRYNEELANPKKQYEEGLATYNQQKDEFTKQVNDAKVQLLEGKLTIIENKKQLLEAQSEFNDQTSAISDEIATLNNQIRNYTNEINAIEEIKVTLPFANTTQTQEAIVNSNENMQDIMDEFNQQANSALNQVKDKVNAMSQELQTTLSNLQTLMDANIALNKANYEIEQASLEVQKQEALLENLEIETNQKLEAAKIELDQAKVQLDQASQKINEVPDGVLYSLSKNENAGYVSFQSDCSSMDALSKIFPLMFFLVAALVSLTTMTRMIEEQRLQSGTLRALGYSKKDVILLYVRYVLLATFFASIVGIILGTIFFPSLVYYLYSTLMYQVQAPTHISYERYIIPLTLLLSVAVTLAVTLLVSYQELNNDPATLLRPKPPKLGKRVLLERWTWFWKKLSFNQKVTVRNMFRYKKRFFMSIVGIAGCSALIVTGFGLKNSVAQIVPKQFYEVWTYDGSASLEENVNENELEDLEDKVNLQYNIQDSMGIYESSAVINSNQSSKDLNVSIRVLSQRYNSMVHYYDETKKDLSLDDDGVILTKKASELLHVKAGDHITLTIKDKNYDVKVSQVCQNYYNHYVYLSKTYYEQLTSQDCTFNQLLFTLKDQDTKLEPTCKASLKTISPIKSITFVSSMYNNFDSMIRSIDLVIVIIIISAALLAFVVLYNLTNINIQERLSEIATIKVLGFFPKEVYDYVFRENKLLSLIGSVVGLFAGKVLHHFVISTVEVDATMFYRHVNILSYVYAFVLTYLFTLIINRVMKKSLNKIDMVASLKSIE